MSAKMQVPLSQRRHTNIAVVRYTKNGVKLEIACYKNKVISYRSGVEDRLDEVLQVDRIFSNVGRGFVAPEKDIQAVFGKDMSEEEAIKFMLVHGELQVAQQERTAEIDELFKDISLIISQKCVNETTQRPFPTPVIEQSLRSIGAAVKLDQPVKKQALSLIHQLIESKIIPIARAKMKVRCTTAQEALDRASEWCATNGAEVLERCDASDGSVASLLVLLPPHLFRPMESFVKQDLHPGSAIHMVDAAVTETAAEGPPECVPPRPAASQSRESVSVSDGDDPLKKKQKQKAKKKAGGEHVVSQEARLSDELQHLQVREEEVSDEESKGKRRKKGKGKREKGPVENVKNTKRMPDEAGEDSDAEVEVNRRQRKKRNTMKTEVWDEEPELLDYGYDEEEGTEA